MSQDVVGAAQVSGLSDPNTKGKANGYLLAFQLKILFNQPSLKPQIRLDDA